MRRGEPVAATEGAVRGTKVTQLSRDPQAWRAWWAEHGGRFQREIRYRAGQPYAPEGVVSTVASERLPRRVRALAAEELAIRYGVDLGFETDLPAASQAQIIAAYRAWAAAEGRTYEPGRWYFAGRPIA